jgi:predicted PurR-regulated permease PerM
MSALPIKRLSASSIVAATCVMALLHFGREVLEPIALAAILSLVIAPLIHSLRRFGLGRVAATFASVTLVGGCAVGVGVILASQLVAVTSDLSHYRAAIHSKTETVRELTERPFARIEAELGALAPQAMPSGAPATAKDSATGDSTVKPIPVEIHEPRLTTRDTLAHFASLAWGPLGEACLVILLLVFILLEHESLRDRLVRLAGQSEVSRTVKTLADAAHGVSRFFFSQFLVNIAFGATIGCVLWAVDVPHAALWGTISGLLRFVPYLGALVAGTVIALFAASIDPGWTLALSCIAVFAGLELVVANIIEPKVYGHSAGLSPLAVIVSALFWGALWGPVGLLISTPLTLCLVVAGRHVRALEPVTILLGEATNVSASQQFYQRLLSGETNAIIQDARAYLRRASFARYCDQVLLPGLALAAAEQRAGEVDETQQDAMRTIIVEMANTLAAMVYGPARRRSSRKVSLLNVNIGAHLRQLREARLGHWQGPLDVPSRSVVVCAGLGSERDDVLNELLVLALREAEIDARSVSVATREERPEHDKAELVFAVFVTYPPVAALDDWLAAVSELREGLPNALLMTIGMSLGEPLADQAIVGKHVDMVLRSHEEGIAFIEPHRVAQSIRPRGQKLAPQAG